LADPRVPGKSLQARTNFNGPEVETWNVYDAASPVSKPAVSSMTCVRKVSPAAATGRTFERRTRPNPCSLFGQVSEADRDTVPFPVTGVPDAMSMARTRAALGVIAFEGTARPAGYHPSMKYWRTIAAAAAATGVA
jgi:hypothetical protein